jgi:hypothetical protein
MTSTAPSTAGTATTQDPPMDERNQGVVPIPRASSDHADAANAAPNNDPTTSRGSRRR